MLSRSPAQAVNNYLEPLQQAISCVCRAVVNVGGGYYVSPSPHVMTLQDGSAVRLESCPTLSLSIDENYSVAESPMQSGIYVVRTESYYYSLLTESGQELISYQWHPQGRSAVQFPHLHLGSGAQVGYENLRRSHLPTNRVQLQDVLYLAITELGVWPLRADWERVLAETRTA